MSGNEYQPVSGLSPIALTTEELVRYAWLHGTETLNKEWIEEILRRLEATTGDGR